MEYPEISDSTKYKENPFKDEIEANLQAYKKSISISKDVYKASTTTSYIPFMQLTESGIDRGLRLTRKDKASDETGKTQRKGSGSVSAFLYFMVMKRVFTEGRDKETGLGCDTITMTMGHIQKICFDLGITPPSAPHISNCMKELFKQRIIAKTTFGHGIYWVNTVNLFNGIRA